MRRNRLPLLIGGKTNQSGRKVQFDSGLRHRNVETCGVNALAMHLFTRFEHQGELFLDSRRIEN